MSARKTKPQLTALPPVEGVEERQHLRANYLEREVYEYDVALEALALVHELHLESGEDRAAAMNRAYAAQLREKRDDRKDVIRNLRAAGR